MASAPQSCDLRRFGTIVAAGAEIRIFVLSHTPASPIRVDGILLQVDRTNRELLLKGQRSLLKQNG
jgi:hypothetical protein